MIDEERKDGAHVGEATHPGYSFSGREFVSPCFLDPELAEPGTEVTVIWGDGEAGADNPRVVPHSRQKEVSAEVVSAKYTPDRRGTKVPAD